MSIKKDRALSLKPFDKAIQVALVGQRWPAATIAGDILQNVRMIQGKIISVLDLWSYIVG
jgi:hypothetical protein